MNSIVILFLFFGACFTLFLLIGNFFGAFSFSTTSLHKKRLDQLKFNNKRTSSEEEFAKNLINKITTPIANKVVPKLNISENTLSDLEKDLRMAKWDVYYNPITFTAMDIVLKALGVFVFLLLSVESVQIASVFLVVLCFGFKFLFKNSINNRRFVLLSDFPEIIKIIQGFLMSGKTLAEAVDSSLPSIKEEWREILREFVVNSSIYTQSECIDMLSEKVDVHEIKILWSLIKVNSEQGIDIKECFANQTEQIERLKMEVMNDKLEKRQMMSIAIQAPLLLTMLFVFGLPTFASMMNTL